MRAVERHARIQRPYANYTVVGAGKTGMDACIWLLQNGVAPARIRWIMPRDAWMLDRASFQPSAENFERSIGSVIGQFQAIAEATSIPDLFERLEERGLLVRIDKSVEPTMYRCAVVSQAELEQLRRIENVVRLGRLRWWSRQRSFWITAPCLQTLIRSMSIAAPPRSKSRQRFRYLTETRSTC